MHWRLGEDIPDVRMVVCLSLFTPLEVGPPVNDPVQHDTVAYEPARECLGTFVAPRSGVYPYPHGQVRPMHWHTRHARPARSPARSPGAGGACRKYYGICKPAAAAISEEEGAEEDDARSFKAIRCREVQSERGLQLKTMRAATELSQFERQLDNWVGCGAWS
jgi:hypothetical protein